MRYINKHRRGVYFLDPEDASKFVALREGKPEGKPMYMVEYHLGDGTHNQYFFDGFDDARRKYMHLCIDQLEECKLFEFIRFRTYSSYHDKYITIFESRCYHPAGLYDTEDSHRYEKGKAPIAPRLRWHGTPSS